MRKVNLSVCALFICVQLLAQSNTTSLAGEWKCYFTDKVTFEYLRLNPDGTGIKCFGQTVNGRDTLLLDHVSALKIINWSVRDSTLMVQSRNRLTYLIDPMYRVSRGKEGQLELTGEHLLADVYPSTLNRDRTKRTVVYEQGKPAPDGFGIKASACIVEDRTLFTLKPLDERFQLAEYKGNDDLIPRIIRCTDQPYEYVKSYPDPPYALLLPRSLHKWSFGFGKKNFYISFDSDKGDSSETSIVIYYDFENDLRDYYFSQYQSGKWKKDILERDGKSIYRGLNWQDKFEGTVYFDRWIAVSYYTRDQKRLDELQKCILSFHYK